MPSPRHSAADVLAQALVDAGQLADPETLQDWTARVGSEPDTPDNVVTLYDTQSKETGRDHNTGRGFSLSGVQVRVRGREHATGWRRASDLSIWLGESLYQRQVTLGGVTYLIHCAASVSDPLAIGKADPAGRRHLFTVNLLVSYRALN